MALPDSVSASVQDYVKAVYSLELRRPSPVSTTELASRLRVTPGAVSGMLRKLTELGLIAHERYRGVRLTPKGRRLALEVLRHHRLIELFLSQELGMPWDRVHDEAEVLEHVLSEELEQVISARLGHPTLDPHGDPIPSPTFEIDEGQTRSLEDLMPGSRGRLVRVSDADPEMLRYLAELRIGLGAEMEVLDRQPFGGPVFVRVEGREIPLGGRLAGALRLKLETREPNVR